MKNNSNAIYYALIAVLCWSTVAPAFKFALNQYSVLTVLTLSTGIAAFILLVIIVFQKKLITLKHIKLKEISQSLIYSIFNPIGYYLILFTAYDRLPAQIAQPLNYVWPISLALLSIPILKQKLKFKSLLSYFISFAGIIIISTQNLDNTPLKSDSIGIILAITSSIVWAIFWLLQTKSKTDKTIQLFLNFSISFIILLTVTSFTQLQLPQTIKDWYPLIHIGIFEFSLTYLLWLTAMKLATKPDIIAKFAFLSPFLSLFLIHLTLKEPIQLETVGGLSLIISGILLHQYLNKNAQ